jgi:hypothetical protein
MSTPNPFDWKDGKESVFRKDNTFNKKFRKPKASFNTSNLSLIPIADDTEARANRDFGIRQYFEFGSK